MLNVVELRQMYRTLGPKGTCQRITESLQRSAAGEIGHLKPSDFSLRALAEGLVENGREWVASMDPGNGGSSVMESINAIDSTAFSNITGQLLINAVMDGYNKPEFVVSGLFPTIETRLNGERIPGIGNLGDSGEVVEEGMPYPHVGLGEDYIDTPATDKRGLIIPITKEAIFFDRTGLLIERAREVGESLRMNKEKRCADLVIGATNNYRWKGTTYNTYQSSAPWINLLAGAGNDLVDWTDVEAAEQLFAEILDPNTGEPIVINPNQILACPAKKHTINRILNATEVRYNTPNGSNPINVETVAAANPLSGYRGATSPWLYSRLVASGLTQAQAKATWFLGDFAGAFRYMQNWGVTVVQAPQNSEAEFNQDIVARFKASERGVPVVWNPRKVDKVNGYS